MNDHLPADWLNGLAEGILGASARVQAERHLVACETCRAEVESMRALRARLHALPREIEPPRDLRPAMWQAIDAARWRERSVWAARWPLAAAALLLIAVTAVLTFALARGPARSPAVAYDAGAPALSSVLSIADRYETATGELQQIIAEHRDRLSPATLRILEENLRVIDGALAESRAALQADPGNGALSAILISAYERKLDVLRAATMTTGI